MSDRDKKIGTIVNDKLVVLGRGQAPRHWFAMRECMNSCLNDELNSFCVHFRELEHCIILMKN